MPSGPPPPWATPDSSTSTSAANLERCIFVRTVLQPAPLNRLRIATYQTLRCKVNDEPNSRGMVLPQGDPGPLMTSAAAGDRTVALERCLRMAVAIEAKAVESRLGPLLEIRSTAAVTLHA